MRKGALAERFRAAEASASPAEGARLLGARFGVSLIGVVPWCWPLLRRLWGLLQALPDGATRRNPALRRIVRVPGDGCGAYRGGATRSPFGPGTIELGLDRLTGTHDGYRVALDRVAATVYHEVGHAVAVRLGLYDTLYHAVPHSPWIFEGDQGAFLQKLLGPDPALLRLGRRYLAQPPGRRRSLRRALDELQTEARRRGRPAPPTSLLRHPMVRHLAQGSRYALPCEHPLRPLPDGTVWFFDAGYRRGFALRAGALRGRVSLYQLRSPNEWFAELFAVHYAGGGPPGRLLRRWGRRTGEIADWLEENVR